MQKNKGADQLSGNNEVDHSVPVFVILKSKISSLLPSSIVVQHGLCTTWSKTPKTVFLMMQVKYSYMYLLSVCSIFGSGGNELLDAVVRLALAWAILFSDNRLIGTGLARTLWLRADAIATIDAGCMLPW